MATPKQKSLRTPSSRDGSCRPGRKHVISTKISGKYSPRKLTRSVLKDHGITYDPLLNDFSNMDLPAHLKEVRDDIMSFDGFLIPGLIKELFQATRYRVQDILSYTYLPNDNLEKIKPR